MYSLRYYFNTSLLLNYLLAFALLSIGVGLMLLLPNKIHYGFLTSIVGLYFFLRGIISPLV